MGKSPSKPQVGDNKHDHSLHAVNGDKNLYFGTRYEPLDENIFKDFDSHKTCERSPPPLFTENPEEKCFRIADDARKTCETVLSGFVMGTTANILMNGKIVYDWYTYTDNAKDMLESLESKSEQWKDTTTIGGFRLRQLAELLNAIKEQDYDKILKIYHRAQHQHTFNIEDKLFVVPVFIHDELDKKWIEHIHHAITEINIAAPGINLHRTYESSHSLIEIGALSNESSKLACTFGSVHDIPENRAKPFIHLGGDWKTSLRKATSLHELMYVLSFPHEMKKFDVHDYIDIDGRKGTNYNIKYNQILTRFDPFRVMMYSGMTRSSKSPTKLSELMKVALNLKFKPCKTVFAKMIYDPKPNTDMQMLYCGREVMVTGNQVGKRTTNGRCGPNNWANCAACRVIIQIEGKEPNVLQKWRKCLDNGKWQGLSGLFYCGKDKCGSETGMPCEDCSKELYKEQGSL